MDKEAAIGTYHQMHHCFLRLCWHAAQSSSFLELGLPSALCSKHILEQQLDLLSACHSSTAASQQVDCPENVWSLTLLAASEITIVMGFILLLRFSACGDKASSTAGEAAARPTKAYLNTTDCLAMKASRSDVLRFWICKGKSF
jgi:hypothetical protein